MKKLRYQLKNVIEPEISDSVLINDHGAFGVKVTYKVSFYSHWFNIGLMPVYKPIPYKTKEKIYLRPLKSLVAKERGRLPKNEWGWQSHPLCSIIFWWEMEHDYGYNVPPVFKEDGKVRNHVLIKRLRAATLKDKVAISRCGFNPRDFTIYE